MQMDPPISSLTVGQVFPRKGLTAAVPIQSVCVYERFVICHVRLPRVAASPNVEEYSPTPALTDRAFWKIAQITARHMERAGGHAFRGEAGNLGA